MSFWSALARKITGSGYDAGKARRRLAKWITSGLGPKTEHLGAIRIRERARDLDRNNETVRAAIDRLVSDVVGTGITPSPKNPEIRRLWDLWAADCDYDGLTDFYGIQSQALMSMIVNGEVFIKVERDSKNVVRLQLLEPDHVPFKVNANSGKNRIIDGIELDAHGRRVAYHILQNHPGDSSMHFGVNDTVRIPASEILHLFRPRRPGQLRGISWLAPAMVKLKNLADFDDAQLERQKLSNLYVGFITKAVEDPSVNVVDPTGAEVDQSDNNLALDLEPGILQELLPGEGIEFTDPPGTTTGYLDFTRSQLRHIAASLGIPYALLTNDFADVNDRVLRVAINHYKRIVQQIVYQTMVPMLCKPALKAFIDSKVLSGELTWQKDHLNCRWLPQPFDYIHPVQDVASKVAQINAGLSSRSDMIVEQGDDPESVDQMIAEDQSRAEKLGLTFKSLS